MAFMRPLFLSLSGLHSFREEQSIDFTKLGKAGVFGIFGATGSGKSTILDAITLALYGKVERAKRGIQGIINQNEDRANVEFVFSIGDRIFAAERTYKKDKDNQTSLLGCRLMEKTNGINKVLVEKNSDMNKKIGELLGLNFDDFTRAVVLPQGKFAEFLMLQGKERRFMLQRIFGLERYGEELQTKVRKRLAIQKQELSIVESRQQELGDVSIKNIEQMKKELNDKRKLSEDLRRKCEKNSERYEELKQIRQIQKELENELKKKKELDDEQDTILLYREKITLATAAQQVYPALQKEQVEEVGLKKAYKEFAGLEHEKELAEKDLEHKKSSHQACKSKKEDSKLLEFKLSKLELLIDDKLSYDKIREKLEDHIKRYNELQKQREKFDRDISELSEKKKKIEATRDEIIKKINEKYITSEEIEKIEKGNKIYQELKNIQEQIRKGEIELREQQLKIDNTRSGINELVKKERQLNDCKSDLDKKISALESELHELEQKNLSFTLAKDLKNGMPCPVCGSLKHPNIAQSINKDQLHEIQKQLEGLKKARDQVVKDLEEVTNYKSKLDGQKKILLEENEKNCTKIGALRSDVEEKQGILKRVCAGLNETEIERKSDLISKNRKTLERLQKARDQISSELDDVNEKLEALIKGENDVLVELGRVEEEGRGYRSRLEDLKTKLEAVTGGRDVFEVKKEIEIKIKKINDELADAEKSMEDAQKKLENIKNKYIAAKSKYKQAKTVLKQMKADVDYQLKEYGFKSRDEVKKLLIDDQQKVYLKKTIEEFEKDRLLNKKAIDDIKQKLGQRSISEKEWDNFIAEKEKAEEQFENVKKDIHVLMDRIDGAKKRRIRWLELNEQKKNLEKAISKLETLELLFRGNTFVGFIATERLKHIAINASKHLSELTNHRYAVEIDSSSGFIMRDNVNGGMLRSASSLSGGEMFLTSLALALALSEQIQLKGRYPLEFFFLDEGFGTLDKELLDTVMNALERLKTQNMMIGIISHVEELKNRIPCYLSVTPADVDGSKIEIKFN